MYVCIYDSIIYPDPQFCLRPMWFNITSQVQRELGLDYAFANTLEVDETTGEDDSAQVSSLFESIDWLKGKFTGKPHISSENRWVPVDFPFNQSFEQWS